MVGLNAYCVYLVLSNGRKAIIFTILSFQNWFLGMSQYFRKFVDSCITYKVARSHSGEVYPKPKVTSPWHTVHTDTTGWFSGKNDKKEQFLVLVNVFT